MTKPATHIAVHNPTTGADWLAPVGYLNQARLRGFVPVNEVEAAQLPEVGFDPARHTVDEVNAYLAEADPDEVERVLNLEAVGKNRSTISTPTAGDPNGA